MKYLLANLGVNVVALACVIGAVVLMMHDKDGWGWLLFIAFCFAAHVTFKK